MKILYFARLREVFGESEQLSGMPDAASLVAHLRARGGKWEEALSGPFRIAVNQELAGMDAKLAEDDEVALFPPVTGG